MPDSLEKFLETIEKNALAHHLGKLNRGLEKESLRIDKTGILSETPHPLALGSALTHPSITTDYSEALLEFVTPVHDSVEQLLTDLSDLHSFTYQHLDGEKLWVNSMPCILKSESSIPIAQYGSSNIARMKQVYRLGLSYRYGSLMQSIAGIHLNFSLADEFWAAYLKQTGNKAIADTRSEYYFSLIRNFHRYAWLPCYLFGASPAVCRTFLQGRVHTLEHFDANSFYAPYATSLRLSGLGYSNKAQDGIKICFNKLESFIKSINQAINTPWPEYQRTGVKVNGEYRQLNANLLQIENEYYSVIRPKRVTNPGESPARALYERGVEYIEVRSLDLDPFTAIGIDAQCVRFFDIFLLYCMFSNSPFISSDDTKRFRENRMRVVMQGRRPGLTLLDDEGEQDFKSIGMTLLRRLEPIANVLDEVHQSNDYKDCLQQQFSKIEEPSWTPSARILQEMKENGFNFFEFAMHKAAIHEKYFNSRALSSETRSKFAKIASRSIEKQKEIENSDDYDFDTFLTHYYERNKIESL